ncbi:hypothetical protein V8G54_005127 [Vigna mungo]|uniref:Chromo domain-containing protein n=1 Tax=Vigna mungo TaxID=3915 RepID=A0AAQ3SF30_VIGMU
MVVLADDETVNEAGEVIVKVEVSWGGRNSPSTLCIEGQTEVVNRCLEAYLQCFVKNSFEIVYGRKPPTLVRITHGETRVKAVAAYLVDRDEAIQQLLQAQQQMKKFADKNVGEWVFIKLRPHRQLTIARRINQKLAPQYYGPFLVVAKNGEVFYKVQLPESAKVHLGFHISQLKKAIGNHAVELTLPTKLSLEEEDKEEPKTMLVARDILEGGNIINQWLVKWKGRTEKEKTWEDEVLLRSQIPSFNLEDKAVVVEGSNDRTLNKDQLKI